MIQNFIFSSYDRAQFKELLIEALVECPSYRKDIVEQQEEKLLTQKEVLELFRITMPTIQSWRRLGIISVVRIGRNVWYRKNDVDKLLGNLSIVKYSRNLCEVG